MLNRFHWKLALWCFLTFAVPAAADPYNPIPRLFQWNFQSDNLVLSTSLPTCTPIGIIVQSEDVATNVTIGVPPYYMMSFAVGSTPVTQLIGEDQNNLQWTIIQPVGTTATAFTSREPAEIKIGSQLLLSVVDSQGNPGGSPPDLITVIAGQTTQCVSTPLNTLEFTVSSDVTGNLNTCSPWGLTISGGSPPYVVTIVETEEPVVTNVTVPFGDNRLIYINRAVPGGQMIAGVSDLNGRWASGTPVVNPVGSTDIDCIGLSSASQNTSLSGAQDDGLPATGVKANYTSIHLREIVAATVASIVTLVLVIAVSFVVSKRRRQRQLKIAAMLPTQFSAFSEQASSGAGIGVTVSGIKLERLDVEAPPYLEYRPAGKITGDRPTFAEIGNPSITEQVQQTTSNRLTQARSEVSMGSLPSYTSL